MRLLNIKIGTHKFSSNLSDRFAKTDEALEAISEWPIFESKERFKIKLEDFR